MPAKVLLVGLGRWGQVHLKTWKQLGAELLLCDQSEALLAQHGAGALKVSTRFEDLIEAADVVDVVTPAPVHRPVVERALEAGKDVHCEKPLAPTSAESYALAELADAKRRILQVGHVFRFDTAVEAAREAIRAGKIGKIRYAISHFMSFKRPRNDGGAAISDGVHFVDLACYLLEQQPERVTAVTRDFLGRGMDDLALITLDFGRALAHVEAAYFPPEKKRDMHVMGEAGAITIDFYAPAKERVKLYRHAHARKGADWTAVEAAGEAIPVAEEEPLKRELADFLRCHETRSAPRADGWAGAHAVAAIEAAEKSAKEGRAVTLELRHPAYAR